MLDEAALRKSKAVGIEKGEASGQLVKLSGQGSAACETEYTFRNKNKTPHELMHKYKTYVFRYINAKSAMMVILAVMARKTVAEEAFFPFFFFVWKFLLCKY